MSPESGNRSRDNDMRETKDERAVLMSSERKALEVLEIERKGDVKGTGSRLRFSGNGDLWYYFLY